jgi:hypothetical protein
MNDKHQFCCGKKNCPTIQQENGQITISDDEAKLGDATGFAAITFREEQAVELGAWLKERGYVK